MKKVAPGRSLIRVISRHALMCIAVVPGMALAETRPTADSQSSIHAVGKELAVGDVVFIQIQALPFDMVANATGSWTNHVGIVIDVSAKEPLIAESRFPFSGETTWSKFVRRSASGRVAVMRLNQPLDLEQTSRLLAAVERRRGILYDTGFDLHSNREFCSRYVREVMDDAAGIKLGEVENFATLLKHNPQANLSFWRIWYFGRIPWQRETVTPASLYRDSRLRSVFDGSAT